ncbi:MAG: TonB-dependent receptor [Deltaproteobacteria bacterium]|nr:TonB-dependent receptor [Deltaproteobacteria bacterium]
MKILLVCLSLALGAPRSWGAPPTPHESGSDFETKVHGKRLRRALPVDDPAAFATTLHFDDPPPGASLGALLSTVPGVQVHDEGVGQRQSLSLRGAESHQVAIFFDDIRLTPPGGGAVDLSLFDPALLDSAEVRRSAGSARFGADAVGGVVVLRSPVLRRQGRTRFDLGYGSWQALVGRALHGGSVGSWRYLASGAYRQSEGDFSFIDDAGRQRERRNNDVRVGEALLKVDRFLGGGRWRLTLMDNVSLAERGAPGPAYLPSETGRQEELRNLIALKAQRNSLWLPGGKLVLSLAQRYGRFHFAEHDPGDKPLETRNQSVGLTLRAALGLPLHPRRARLDAGLELRQELFFDAQWGDHERTLGDLFFSGSFAFFRERLVLVPATRLVGASDFGVAMVPKFGLVFRPLRHLTRAWPSHIECVGNIGRSYRYPSFQEQYVRLDGFGGNAKLRPEDALSADAGLRVLTSRVSMEVAYFHRVLANTILYAPVSSFLVRPDNYSQGVARGVEAAFEVKPGAGLALRMAYTYTHTRWGRSALALPGKPRHYLMSRLGWSGATCGAWVPRWARALSTHVMVAAQGEVPLDRFNNLPFEEGRVLLSVGARYTYRQLTLMAEGRNLLDKRDAVDRVGFPLPPARFFVSLRVVL